jgi:hypothetical protein
MKIYSDEKIDKIITAHGRFHFLRLFITILLVICIYLIFNTLSNSLRMMFAMLIVMFGINYIIQTKRGFKKIRGTITTEEILNNGKTGDLILFKTNHNHDIPDLLIFKIIPTNLTGDIWTNIGILYKDDNTKEVFIWLCDDEKKKDLNTNKNKTGVKKLLFLDLVKDYDGIVAHCQVKTEVHNNDLIKKIKPYSKFPFMNIESLLGNPNNRRGIGSCKFISSVLKDIGFPIKKSLISHPLTMVGDNHSSPEILVK